jgi:hypothetical protein
MELNTVVKYIENKNWTLQKEGVRYVFYKPPTELGFAESYTLPIPKLEKSSDFQIVLQDTVRLIADIYHINISELNMNLTYFDMMRKDARFVKLMIDEYMKLKSDTDKKSKETIDYSRDVLVE